ncbi:MAG: hypothetical protein KGQ59_06475 [Bdellovibrionales bacterium]|nr:hypothetical protein [Bdellovibrionales bacterium]
MLMKNVLKISQKSLTLAALAMAFAGCGQQDSSPLTPWGNTPNGTCPTGTQFIAGYGCMYTGGGGGGGGGSFITASTCTSKQLSSNQVELACWVYPAYYSSSSVPNFPYLASAGSISEAWVGPEVKVGDKVTLQGALRYGGAYIGSIFGDCKDEKNASSIVNGAVGSSALFALPIGTEVTVSAAGTLRFGMSQRYSCYEAGQLYVRIIRNQ